MTKHRRQSPFHYTLACTAHDLSLSGKSVPVPPIKDKISTQVIFLLGTTEIKETVKLSHIAFSSLCYRNSPHTSIEDILGKLLSQAYNLIKAETK